MRDASSDLLKAVRAAILADGFLAGKFGTRVFSSWGNQAETAPLARLAITGVRPFEIDGGGSGSETDVSVHVFTSEPAPIDCNAIAAQVREVLQDAHLSLDNSDLVSLDFRDAMPVFDDQSPTLQKTVVRFRALTTST